MSLDQLPLELVTLIVDTFRDDREFLKTISLVSRPFLNACRTHLFTTLRIHSLNPSFNYKCSAWSKFLRTSSALLPYLRVLELGPPIFRLRARNPALCSKHWTATLRRGLPSIHDDRIEFIMAGATNVHTVTLRFEFQSWRNFSLSFQRTVINLVRRESVSSISIEDAVDFPLHALGICRRLRDLSLISVNRREQLNIEEGPIDRQGHARRGHLQSLTLFASDECVEHLVRILTSPRSTLDLSRLQMLSVNTTGTDGRNALKRIPASARSITTLELRLSDQKEYDLCDLNLFPNLRTLFISASYNRLRRPIVALSHFLSRSPSRSTLEELKILFRQDVPEFEEEKSSQELTRICTNRDWRVLEQKLTLHNQFSSLRKMILVFRPKDVTTFMSEYLRLSLHLSLVEVMPKLYALTSPTIEVNDDRFEQYTQD
ncbi:hypothetical protein GALMADRAFT_146218 [Galerina marginata CBS 339.88]|uniref:F-box domain-containing protein n=1 Tax=Galerina marginata (strain CBS 339.88) TaxID=685588 RepID=A0A067SCE8_GALM3|nr:hypothetical protein GALMADRAFT_146218 [Galerina marginata CBS 339.88]